MSSAESIQSTLTAYQQVASLLNYMYTPSLYTAAAATATTNPASAAAASQMAQMSTLLNAMFAMRSQQPQSTQPTSTSEAQPTTTQETAASAGPAHSPPRPSPIAATRKEPQEVPEEMDTSAPLNMEVGASTSAQKGETGATSAPSDVAEVATNETAVASSDLGDVLDLSKQE